MNADRLKKLALFGDLPHKQLVRIAMWADEVDLPAGKPLMAEGNWAHEFFVIESGTASVDHENTHVADLGPGDFFGEMALLEHQRRSATVTTSSPMRAIVMHAREFAAMDAEMPEITERIRAVMRARQGTDQGR
jgi:CRP/FNR family transcriptional regulator, cyclic AMP receptor protein